MYLVGISAYYHDAAAVVIRDGEILAAAQEERFTRRKHDPSFPAQALAYCLDHAGITLGQVEAVVFYEKPFLKFERLLESYYTVAPRGIRSFLTAMPGWLREKLPLKRQIGRELARLSGSLRCPTELLFAEHHLSHSASAYFPSPFDEAAVVTIDGAGEWATATIGHGVGNHLELLKELRFPHSLGLLYSAFTQYLGFRVNSGEYKLMGLAPYGNPDSDRVVRYEELIRRELVELSADGSLWLNQEYFDYAAGLRMTREDRWQALFGIPPRSPDQELRPEQCDLALAIQRVTEDAVIRMAHEAQRLTKSRRLCLAGGVALNCVANGRLLRSGLFDELWVQPAAGDAGGALGAALAVHHLQFNGSRRSDGVGDRMQGGYLGPEYSSLEVERMVRHFGAVADRFDRYDDLCCAVAALLVDGNVIGWFQGRMEWGPRALGNRSILADPRNPEMQRKLNQKIKFREGFRPFAPAVLAERAGEYFQMSGASPYMLVTADLIPERRRPLPAGYHEAPLREKLAVVRSDLPAVTHVDFSARVQTVHRETNPRFWGLIEAFRHLTGCSVLINTSFNVRGEPIVLTPDDAYSCFMATEMDYLVIGDFLFARTGQPPWTGGSFQTTGGEPD